MSDQVVIKRIETAAEAQQAFCCMAEVPVPWPAAVNVCRNWVGLHLGRYVEGYHAQEADGVVVGQLYYAASERALVPYAIEPGVAVLYCEWVQRRRQRQGLGRQLFAAFEADARAQGSKGILVEATEREDQMHYRHYLARGFQEIHAQGDRRLLYLPLRQSQVSVRPLESQIRPRSGVPVEILILAGYLCPFETAGQLLLLEVAAEFGERVVICQEALTPQTLQRYGVAYGVFINGRPKLSGVATEDAIRQAIREEF